MKFFKYVKCLFTGHIKHHTPYSARNECTECLLSFDILTSVRWKNEN